MTRNHYRGDSRPADRPLRDGRGSNSQDVRTSRAPREVVEALYPAAETLTVRLSIAVSMFSPPEAGSAREAVRSSSSIWGKALLALTGRLNAPRTGEQGTVGSLVAAGEHVKLRMPDLDIKEQASHGFMLDALARLIWARLGTPCGDDVLGHCHRIALTRLLVELSVPADAAEIRSGLRVPELVIRSLLTRCCVLRLTRHSYVLALSEADAARILRLVIFMNTCLAAFYAYADDRDLSARHFMTHWCHLVPHVPDLLGPASSQVFTTEEGRLADVGVLLFALRCRLGVSSGVIQPDGAPPTTWPSPAEIQAQLGYYRAWADAVMVGYVLHSPGYMPWWVTQLHELFAEDWGESELNPRVAALLLEAYPRQLGSAPTNG